MKPSKFNCILGIGVMTLLLCDRAAVTSSGAPPVALSAGQIFETMRENYASMASYSDQGEIITTAGDATLSTRFTTRLGRPGRYRIQWDRISRTSYSSDDTGPVGAWSSGAGDYLLIDWAGVRRQLNLDTTLLNVASSSGGTVANVPSIFFNAKGGGSPNKLIGLESLPDEKIGKIECYVVTGQSASGVIDTFWIGKQDFLIHQIRTDVSSDVLQSALAQSTGQNWQPGPDFHGSSTIETYTNIVLDPRFSRTDFIPTFPQYQQ